MSDKKVELTELSLAKRAAQKKVEQLAGDSEWSLLEQILQEIEATYFTNGQKSPGNQEFLDLLIKEVNVRYEEDEEIKKLLLEAVPSRVTIGKWRKKKGWEEALWAKVRVAGLFTSDKRASVINQLFTMANSGNVNAAKVWLTLSGDYQEKGDTKSEVLDQFREINNILLNNNKK